MEDQSRTSKAVKLNREIKSLNIDEEQKGGDQLYEGGGSVHVISEERDDVNSVEHSSMTSARLKTKESLVINYLSEGSYFGEIALITNLKRTASVKATDNCTLSTMSKHVLSLAKEEYP